MVSNNVFRVSFDKPLYAGDNLENVQFNRLDIRLSRPEDTQKDEAYFLNFEASDFLRENYYKDVFVSGFSEIEYDKAKDVYFRWTEGPVALFSYTAKSPQPATFRFHSDKLMTTTLLKYL